MGLFAVLQGARVYLSVSICATYPKRSRTGQTLCDCVSAEQSTVRKGGVTGLAKPGNADSKSRTGQDSHASRLTVAFEALVAAREDFEIPRPCLSILGDWGCTKDVNVLYSAVVDFGHSPMIVLGSIQQDNRRRRSKRISARYMLA